VEVLRAAAATFAAATCFVMKGFFAATGQPLLLDDPLDPSFENARSLGQSSSYLN